MLLLGWRTDQRGGNHGGFGSGAVETARNSSQHQTEYVLLQLNSPHSHIWFKRQKYALMLPTDKLSTIQSISTIWWICLIRWKTTSRSCPSSADCWVCVCADICLNIIIKICWGSLEFEKKVILGNLLMVYFSWTNETNNEKLSSWLRFIYRQETDAVCRSASWKVCL
jgi:hypothetical protein